MDFLTAILKILEATTGEYRVVHWPVHPPHFHPPAPPALQDASPENQLRGWIIIGQTRRVYLQVHELMALRLNSIGDLYPAATQLRTKFGSWDWTYLEKYRGVVTYLAFSTLRGKRTSVCDLPVLLKAFLNENMESHIRTRYGEPLSWPIELRGVDEWNQI